jgi:hypothetical protein
MDRSAQVGALAVPFLVRVVLNGIDEAPAPFLAGLVGAHHRVTRGRRVRPGMPAGALVAAAHVAAALAAAEVHPVATAREAFLAAGRRRRDVCFIEAVEVAAGRHRCRD